MRILEIRENLRVIIKKGLDMNDLQEISINALDVKTKLHCGAVIIKLYKVPTKYKCNRNIVGENEAGETIWQIEDVNPSLDSPFSSIEPFDKEKIIAHNWIGADYYIEIRTGKLEIINKNARLW